MRMGRNFGVSSNIKLRKIEGINKLSLNLLKDIVHLWAKKQSKMQMCLILGGYIFLFNLFIRLEVILKTWFGDALKLYMEKEAKLLKNSGKVWMKR